MTEVSTGGAEASPSYEGVRCSAAKQPRPRSGEDGEGHWGAKLPNLPLPMSPVVTRRANLAAFSEIGEAARTPALTRARENIFCVTKLTFSNSQYKHLEYALATELSTAHEPRPQEHQYHNQLHQTARH